MGASAAGARLNKTAEEGAALLDSFFAGFPKVKEAIEQSKEFLKEHGYVEDLVGRRRRLDDISLEPYKAQLRNKEASDADFNPFLACKDRETSRNSEKAWMQILSQYILLSNASKAASAIMERRKPDGERAPAKCAFEDKNEIPNQTFDKLAKLARNPEYLSRQMWATNGKRTYAQKVADDALTVRRLLTTGEYSFYEPSTKRKAVVNIVSELPEFTASLKRYTSRYGTDVQTEIPQEPTVLSAYTGRIAQAARQCFNSRIQGGSSSLTKLAMVDISKDPRLREWQADLIITVHDEVLVECPALYAEQVEKRLPEVMINAAKEAGSDVPQACDPYNVTRWASDVMAATVQEEFKKLEHKGLSRDESLQKVIESHSEIPAEAIVKTIETGCDLDF